MPRIAIATRQLVLLTLMDSGVDPVFCDFPQVPGAMGRFMLTQMVAVAELEAGLISERTKAALQAARARGTRLGNPRLSEPKRSVRPPYGLPRPAERPTSCQSFGRYRRPATRATTPLNRRGVKTARGGRWAHVQVGMILARHDALSIARCSKSLMGELYTSAHVPVLSISVCLRVDR